MPSEFGLLQGLLYTNPSVTTFYEYRLLWLLLANSLVTTSHEYGYYIQSPWLPDHMSMVTMVTMMTSDRVPAYMLQD